MNKIISTIIINLVVIYEKGTLECAPKLSPLGVRTSYVSAICDVTEALWREPSATFIHYWPKVWNTPNISKYTPKEHLTALK